MRSSYYLMPEQQHAELHTAILNAREALTLALASNDLGAGPDAVVVMVRDLLDQWAESLDSVNMTQVGLEESSHA